jgi:glycosyltransferase involved in cell wall biosynthesis
MDTGGRLSELEGASGTGPRALARQVVRTARSVERSLPGPARVQLRKAARWTDQHRPAAPIEGWAKPLVGTSAQSGRGDILATSARGASLGVVEPVGPADAPAPDGADGPRCLIVTGLLDVGGMDEMVAFLARRLPALGLQTAVLHATARPSASGAPSGRLGRMLAASGITVREASPQGTRAFIQQWQPAVITAHGAPDWVLDVARSEQVPYVDNLHGMHMLFWADWNQQAARSEKYSAMVSVSELVRQQYLRGNPGFAPDRLVTIPNGVDEERRVRGDRAAARERLGLTDEYVFVSLARHCLQKNSYGLITAFGEVAARYKQAHLVIAGRPDPGRYYRNTIRLRDSLPGRDRIHLRNHAGAPAELLAAADGFVLDSFFEGWSLASMEALFAGLPVVLSDVGGAREQVGGDPSRGQVVTNPLGNPLEVDWQSVGAARYRPQVNRDELVGAMGSLIMARDEHLAHRVELQAESAQRFSAAACLAQHAALLRAVATTEFEPAGHQAAAHEVTQRR